MSAALRKVKTKRRRSKTPTLKTILKNKQKKVRLVLLTGGIIMVFFGLYRPSYEKPKPPEVTESIEVSSFAGEPVKIDQGLTKERSKKDREKLPPTRILIPDLKIDLLVKEALVKNGYWEVFSDAAGFGAGSAYPEEDGNQVIFAHARQGMFAPLKDAKTGQNIMVFTRDKWYSYTISDIKEVLPNQLEVIAPTKEAILTLYTCSGYADSKRLIVVAKKNPAE